jgi:hypothetical protein
MTIIIAAQQRLLPLPAGHTVTWHEQQRQKGLQVVHPSLQLSLRSGRELNTDQLIRAELNTMDMLLPTQHCDMHEPGCGRMQVISTHTTLYTVQCDNSARPA